MVSARLHDTPKQCQHQNNFKHIHRHRLPLFTTTHLSFRLLLGFLGELHPFVLFDRVKRIHSQMHLKHRRSLIHTRQGDIDTLLESTEQKQSVSSKSVNLQAYRLRIAASSAHGIFVAASIITPVLRFPTPTSMFIPSRTPRAMILVPCICTRNSVLTRRDDSDSVSLRWPHMESISSMKTMHGCRSRASSNRDLTLFSLSPTHFDRISAEDMEMKVLLHSVAIAFAK